ncbi:hypothetical protein C8A03DRAFT_33541 [Achaetomium macrosporum]|uniref:Chromatin modification-related protein n=1 Tax=Achaetomium macrosporum TaxID=79813 RepID=A0AAN7CAI9_9PEZI|nr:hypothetical protein C8A03DRAFT_33541 [Achaetomium macrosporum]
MKTAKPPVPEGATGSSRRAQPVRQTRVNPPRTSSLNRLNPLASAPAPEQPINILPGVTHFADAITALPKELVRHFTLLKEVDAKIFAPEAALFQLLNEALNTPAAVFTRPLNDASSSTASVSAPANAQNTIAGVTNPPPPPSEGSVSSVFHPANIPRRTLFRDTALKIQGMLVSMEEKNHLIATANDALQKQLSRIEDIWPHLEAEFSDEAKWGSTTHWAYVENRQAKANDKQAERSRREGAATLSAAAQQLAEEAAARSNDRKQALAAKKNSKNQTTDADGDKAQDSGKKSQGAKARKPLPDSGPVGLGISNPAPSGTAPPNKRRKVEAAKPNGGTPTERAMSTVFNNNASKQKTTSPRETPAPESGNKKRKALPTSSNQAKRSRANATMSPSLTSSPVIGSLPDPIRAGRGSPAPSAAAPRPASSRARRNSTQSSVENTRQRPPSTTSNKPNGNYQETPDPGQPSNGARANADTKAQKEAAGLSLLNKPSSLIPETEDPPLAPEPAQNGNKKEAAIKPTDEREQQRKDTAPLAIQPTSTNMARTKSGRASKPSTPATATFAEAASSTAATTSSRSRPSRNNTTESGGSAVTNTAATTTVTTSTSSATTTTTTSSTTKRSHKKGASISATAVAVSQVAQQAATAVEKDKEKDREPAASSKKDRSNNGAHAEEEDDEEQDGDDEPVADDELYCFCNQGSYGEMVACDGEGCPREWFHLECVGLKVAPKGNAKWYCEDCKKRLKIAERR